jgi:hypothetical protein
MSRTEQAPEPTGGGARPPKRHRWEKINDYRKRCQDCDMLADRRPHPYGRRWWTEWTLGDKSWNTLQGDTTPPCEPAA